MESQYNEVSVESWFTGQRLCVHVVEKQTLKSLQYRLIILHDSEKALNGGRFKKYDSTISDNPIFHGIFRHYDDFKQAFVNAVEWLAENVCGKWSFFIGQDNDCVTLTFCFDDASDAVIFRISTI